MSGPAKQRVIAPGLKWKVEHGGVHDPNCPNPNCPYGPTAPEQPDAPPIDNPAPPIDNMAELKKLIQQNADAIALLAVRDSTPGPPGERGPAGPPGDVGATGDVATINEAAIEAMSDKAITALAKRLPPLTFQALLPNGEEYGDPRPKWLGDTLYQDSILFSAKNHQPVVEAK